MDETNPGSQTPDISFQVMPKSGSKISYTNTPPPPPVLPQGQSVIPPEHKSSGNRFVYIIAGLIILVILAGAAYYFLGMKKPNTTTQTAASKLSKAWLTQNFGSDTCTDNARCGDNADPDSDGLSNYNEFIAGTNPMIADTDKDGLADGDEVNVYNTDPLKKYTDTRSIAVQNDYNDGSSIKNGYDPLTPGTKLTDTRLQKIQSNIASFKLHAPTTATLGLNPDGSKASGASSTQSSNTTSVNTKTYVNSKYGYQFDYPSNWQIENAVQSGIVSQESLSIKPTTETASCYGPKPFPVDCITVSVDASSNGDLSAFEKSPGKSNIVIDSKSAIKVVSGNSVGIIVPLGGKPVLAITEASQQAAFNTIIASLKFSS